MATRQMQRSQEYAQAVAAIIAGMPPERAEQVYDLALFLQTRKAAPSSIAEDAVWEATYARHKDKFLTLRAAARAEIEAGATADLMSPSGSVGSIAPWASTRAQRPTPPSQAAALAPRRRDTTTSAEAEWPGAAVQQSNR